MAEAAVDALKRNLDLIIAADYMTALADLTPEAMNEAMALAAGISTQPEAPTGYEVIAEEVSGDDHRFRVTLQGPTYQLRMWSTWRQIDGVWKIASLGVEPDQ